MKNSNEIAIQARREYYRKYYEKNKERIKKRREQYWLNRALREIEGKAGIERNGK